MNALSETPEFWNDPQKAQKLTRERNSLDTQISSITRIEREHEDALAFIELGEAEGDEASINEGESMLRGLVAEVDKARLDTLLSGEADSNDTYLEVHAGAGGTESQDWANMLSRMYTRWAEKRGFKVEEMDRSDGEEAGIKSVTYQVKGENAYGWLKTEAGVHRLVRISPYDSNARRHTSFASVTIYPVVDDSIQIDLNPAMSKHRPCDRRRGRPARQQDRVSCPPDPQADRHSGCQRGSAFATSEPRYGVENAASKAL